MNYPDANKEEEISLVQFTDFVDIMDINNGDAATRKNRPRTACRCS